MATIGSTRARANRGLFPIRCFIFFPKARKAAFVRQCRTNRLDGDLNCL